MKRVPLLARIVIAIALGIALGAASSAMGVDWPVRTMATFNSIFGQFLGFAIPLIIVGFIVPGIGSLDRGAGKMLGRDVGAAYTSSVLAGLFALTMALLIYPGLLAGQQVADVTDPEQALLAGYFTVEIPPLMPVMTALVLAFVLGVGISALGGGRLMAAFTDFQTIIQKLLEKIIIPLLPVHIFGVFANMTYAGQVGSILAAFGKVFVLVILMHFTYLLFLFVTAGAVGKANPFRMLKSMLPAYFTAIGTQSSAATIPVTLRQAKIAGVHPRVADFAIPLNATIHLAGSMITITACAVAVQALTTGLPTFVGSLGLIFLLAIMMVAAPGVPGGAIMSAIGLLQAQFGFTEATVALMIALYLAQDSFGTATNVTGDAAIAKIVEAMSREDLPPAEDTVTPGSHPEAAGEGYGGSTAVTDSASHESRDAVTTDRRAP